MGEVKPPELLRRALKEAMSRFAGEAQRELKHSAALRRRNSLQHVAALSVRRLELGSSLLLSMRCQASHLNMLSRPVPQPPSPTAGPLGRLFTPRNNLSQNGKCFSVGATNPDSAVRLTRVRLV